MSKSLVKTKHSRLCAADICRANGWEAGTVLRGTEYDTTNEILITAVGVRTVLAKTISENGKPYDGYETTWTLNCREWERARAGRGDNNDTLA